MRVGIFGTGMVGQALASRLADLAHDVMIGTRDVAVFNSCSTVARVDARISARWSSAVLRVASICR